MSPDGKRLYGKSSTEGFHVADRSRSSLCHCHAMPSHVYGCGPCCEWNSRHSSLLGRMAGFMLKETTVKGSLSYTHGDFQQIVEAFKEGTKYVDAMVSPSTTDILVLSLTGKFGSVSKMATSRIALEDAVHKDFEDPGLNKDNHIKILVTLRHDNLGYKSEGRVHT
jgi:hypothetical protein